jgi:hypothetical protein
VLPVAVVWCDLPNDWRRASEHQSRPADPAATEHGRQAARSVVVRVGVGDVRARSGTRP